MASFTTKNQWIDIDGILRQIGLDVDVISDFSSEGPLRNNAQKPDVTAPGAMIASALWADFTPLLRNRIQNQPNFVMMAGTSMATRSSLGECSIRGGVSACWMQ